MLKLDLKPLLEARFIEQPYAFLCKKGFSHTVALKLLSGDTKSCQLSHIEQLCDIFLCSPNDLFVWEPKAEKRYPENYPLKKLQRQSVDFDFNQKLRQMSIEELQEFAKETEKMMKKEE